MKEKPPWVWALLGALSIIAVLGFSGHLTSCAAIDRTLNPDARHYWESEEDYLQRLVEGCPPGDPEIDSATQACLERSIAEARRRGYLK